ncbi:TIGR03809 family protein [Afipia sp. TerB]
MTQADSKLGRSIVVRWRMLAEQRLNHLIELHQTGRWRRYHDEADFHEMVREARAALRVWEELAPPDPLHDKAIEISLEQARISLQPLPSHPFDDLADRVRADHDLRKA